jgi:hypothetical protein
MIEATVQPGMRHDRGTARSDLSRRARQRRDRRRLLRVLGVRDDRARPPATGSGHRGHAVDQHRSDQSVVLRGVLWKAALCAILAIASLLRWSEPDAIFLLAGGLLYLVGTILVTLRLNVPLNDALAAARPESAQASALGTRYLTEWTAWNHLRTAASLAAAAAFIGALIA